ncbi:MAG: hypothetical protein FE835_13930, partial [Gammaproteobacteria bacterium]|nr:hypothetical protein [Gammaproteobacteria bacterium]
TGMLRAAYAYCGLPAFVSLSMAGSESDSAINEVKQVLLTFIVFLIYFQ